MSDFKIGPLNHVGVAVPNIEQACETYRTLYGATDITTPFDMPEQGVKVCFVNLPNSQIELIEPLNDASPIANFIKKNPSGGQHHVCFEVADINQAVTR
jgi:methylmalonyl-CoA/ethylmalonyl-CoA epimerase